MTSKMSSTCLQEIPDFIVDSIAHCDNLTFKRNKRSCFMLAKSLKFYEFREKQLLRCLDLSGTCLSSIQKQIQMFNNEIKCKLGADATNANDLQIQPPLEESTSIRIEKYTYRNFEIYKLYLILHCYDKLIIMEHSKNGMNLVREYENVTNFKIVHNTLVKYQTELKIQLGDGSTTRTNFQENSCNEISGENSDGSKVTQRNEFKHLLDRVRTTKAELQLHKEITQKQFQNICSAQTFGSNFLRSTKLEEKCPLSKCGDLWIRITATDELVLGLPLVNNYALPTLTVLKNLQPIININGETTFSAKENKINNNLHFEHRFYQLQQTFENLETVERFFQTQDVHFHGESTWQRDTTNQLQPNSFVVMLLKLKLSQLILINTLCQLFVRFTVEKDLETLKVKKQIFEQHLFVKSLDFNKLLHQRSLYEISFKEQTLHQDLLAVAMISCDFKLHIDFVEQSDLVKFERLLATRFDFYIVHRKVESNISRNSTAMDVAVLCDDRPTSIRSTLFYNCKPNSIWFGSLVLRQAVPNVSDNDESLPSDWIFYNKNEEKGILMIKLLFDELISIKCNIKYGNQQHDCKSKFISLENAIREELNAFSELQRNINKPQSFPEKYKTLAEYQFRTDVITNGL